MDDPTRAQASATAGAPAGTSGAAAAAAAPGRAAPGSAATPPPSLLQSLQRVWRDLPGLLGDRMELLGLELRRAGQNLLQAVALLVAVAVLGATAWLALWAGIVAVLWSLGLHLAWALLAAMLINLAGAAAALLVARGRLRRPQLAATRRHLHLKPSLEPRVDERAEPSPAAGQPLAS